MFISRHLVSVSTRERRLHGPSKADAARWLHRSNDSPHSSPMRNYTVHWTQRATACQRIHFHWQL